MSYVLAEGGGLLGPVDGREEAGRFVGARPERGVVGRGRLAGDSAERLGRRGRRRLGLPLGHTQLVAHALQLPRLQLRHLLAQHPRAAYLSSWRRGVVVSGVRRMNEVNPRRARLVLGWVTVFGRVYHLGMQPAAK